ncbi:hypothetical protein Tco_1093371 [Tanacetum coccineum]|uniref:Uncharacterized protein n=1 Tax=Tanacetum coccineum TaxID=301880 RepID=A0ABQ5IEQ5_9ASTR
MLRGGPRLKASKRLGLGIPPGQGSVSFLLFTAVIRPSRTGVLYGLLALSFCAVELLEPSGLENFMVASYLLFSGVWKSEYELAEVRLPEHQNLVE